MSLVFSITTQAQARIVMDPDEACRLAATGNGAWMDLEGLRSCLRAKEGVTFTETLLEHSRADLEACNEALKIAGDSEDSCVQLSIKMDAQIQEREFLLRELRRDIKLWYRQPLIVGPAGFILGTLLATGVVLAL